MVLKKVIAGPRGHVETQITELAMHVLIFEKNELGHELGITQNVSDTNFMSI